MAQRLCNQINNHTPDKMRKNKNSTKHHKNEQDDQLFPNKVAIHLTLNKIKLATIFAVPLANHEFHIHISMLMHNLC